MVKTWPNEAPPPEPHAIPVEEITPLVNVAQPVDAPVSESCPDTLRFVEVALVVVPFVAVNDDRMAFVNVPRSAKKLLVDDAFVLEKV